MPKRKRKPPTPEVIARRETARELRRAEEVARMKKAAELEAERREQDDERIAPAAQRRPVAVNGTLVRHPRLERDGLMFVRSNPIAHLVARGVRRAESGGEPTITRDHERAAFRLIDAWEIAGAGVSHGTANYGERASGVPQSGSIADAVLASISRQHEARAELEDAHAFLGALWPVVHATVLRGLVVTVWAQTRGMERQAAVGYLAAALDRLVEFYRPKARVVPIRAATVFASREVVDTDATS